MTKLIIGAIDNLGWNQIKHWCNSIEKFKPEDARVVIVAMNVDTPTVHQLVQRGIEVVHVGAYSTDTHRWVYTPRLTVHVERFAHIWEYLRRNESEFDQVVMTDVRDVVFQADPFEFMDRYPDKLIAGSECMTYEDEPWGSENLLQTFGSHIWNIYKNQTIYNVGVLGGPYHLMTDLSLMIYQMSLGRPIPIVDQAVFNFLLWQEPWNSSTMFCHMEDGWAIHCGTVADPRKPEFLPKLLEDPTGIGFSKMAEYGDIVMVGTSDTDMFEIPLRRRPIFLHQWDRNPEFKEMVERVYG